MGKSIMHFEVMGKDPAKLQKFYSAAFGWKVEPGKPPTYGRVEAGNGVTGGIGQNDVPNTPNVTFYIGVQDLDASLRKIEEGGGRTVLAPTDVHGEAKIALFADPDGNVIGLVESD